MKIILASDHVGRGLKDAIAQHLAERGGHALVDAADSASCPVSADGKIEYAVPAVAASRAVAAGEHDRAILCCGGGIGMAIAANKVAGIRAVVCSEPYSAVLSREHQDTNVLALGSQVVGIPLALMIVDQWLDAGYDGGWFDGPLARIAAVEQGGDPA